jgi:hypothetical protein
MDLDDWLYGVNVAGGLKLPEGMRQATLRNEVRVGIEEAHYEY